MKKLSLFLIVASALIALTQTRGRSAATDGRFTADAPSGLIVDAVTGLRWRSSDVNVTTWANANSTCGTPYRLPSTDELASIVDERISDGSPAADPIFALQQGVYWTSTPGVGGGYWVVGFNEGGQMSTYSSASNAGTRCVR